MSRRGRRETWYQSDLISSWYTGDAYLDHPICSNCPPWKRLCGMQAFSVGVITQPDIRDQSDHVRNPRKVQSPLLLCFSWLYGLNGSPYDSSKKKDGGAMHTPREEFPSKDRIGLPWSIPISFIDSWKDVPIVIGGDRGIITEICPL